MRIIVQQINSVSLISGIKLLLIMIYGFKTLSQPIRNCSSNERHHDDMMDPPLCDITDGVVMMVKSSLQLFKYDVTTSVINNVFTRV